MLQKQQQEATDSNIESQIHKSDTASKLTPVGVHIYSIKNGRASRRINPLISRIRQSGIPFREEALVDGMGFGLGIAKPNQGVSS